VEAFDANEKALGDLFGARSSDDIPSIVAKAGLRVDWELTDAERFCDKTRKRAYWQRITVAMKQVSGLQRTSVLRAIDAQLGGGAAKRTDSLLPLFDRSEFDADLAELALASGPEAPGTLIILDIDNFKAINDTFGHEAGDRALKGVAQVLLRVVEKKGGSAYRYGGDELCIVLRNFSTSEGAAVAERIRQEIEATQIEGSPAKVTASVGVACFPESTADRERLFRGADEAMYKSKSAGGNQVSLGAAGSADMEQAPPRLTAQQIENRIAAVDLELAINEAVNNDFRVTVNNTSDEAVVVKKAKLSYNGVKLAETPPPGPKDDWSICTRGRRPIAWSAANTNPFYKLASLLGTFDRESEAVLDVEILAEVLGKPKACPSRIHVKVEPGGRRIWQIG
jgi:diguanylate cyclase (GGDEF)-like protein